MHRAYFVHSPRGMIGKSLITAGFSFAAFPMRLLSSRIIAFQFCKALALWRRFKAHRQSKLTVLFQHESETGTIGTSVGTTDYVTFCDFL